MCNWHCLVIVLLASLLSLSSGYVSLSKPVRAESEHGYLTDPQWTGRIIAEKYDRAKLAALMGPPTIDDGEEWVYVSKFVDARVVPLDMIMAIYASEDKPKWKMTVVTFDEAGPVSRIQTTSVRSEIAEEDGFGAPAQWTFLGMHFDKRLRMR